MWKYLQILRPNYSIKSRDLEGKLFGFLSGLPIIVQLLGAEDMEVSGDDDDTGGNETEDDGSEGNLITGLFAGSLSEGIVNFFGGIIDWFTSLF